MTVAHQEGEKPEGESQGVRGAIGTMRIQGPAKLDELEVALRADALHP